MSVKFILAPAVSGRGSHSAPSPQKRWLYLRGCVPILIREGAFIWEHRPPPFPKWMGIFRSCSENRRCHSAMFSVGAFPRQLCYGDRPFKTRKTAFPIWWVSEIPPQIPSPAGKPLHQTPLSCCRIAGGYSTLCLWTKSRQNKTLFFFVCLFVAKQKGKINFVLSTWIRKPSPAQAISLTIFAIAF